MVLKPFIKLLRSYYFSGLTKKTLVKPISLRRRYQQGIRISAPVAVVVWLRSFSLTISMRCGIATSLLVLIYWSVTIFFLFRRADQVKLCSRIRHGEFRFVPPWPFLLELHWTPDILSNPEFHCERSEEALRISLQQRSSGGRTFHR